MTNAELLAKIKAKIKRMLLLLGQGYDEIDRGQIAAYEHLLSFLSTLESEHLVDARKTSSKDLEEAAVEYSQKVSDGHNYRDLRVGFIAGAKWQAAHTPLPEDTVLFNKGVAEGKRLMMEEAVEGYVNYYEDSGGILMAEAQVGCPYHNGDKVRIIILPKED